MEQIDNIIRDLTEIIEDMEYDRTDQVYISKLRSVLRDCEEYGKSFGDDEEEE